MQQDRIEELFARMREPAGGIDPFIQTRMLDAMVGRSLEVVIPVLEAAHARMPSDGFAFLPDGVLARAVKCPEGPHGGVWRKAVLLEGQGMNLLAVLKVGGEPNPAVDAILKARLGDRYSPHSLAVTLGNRVHVYVVSDAQQVTEALASNAADKWSHLLALEGHCSFPPFDKDEGWSSPNRNAIRGGEGLDAWVPFFCRIGDLFRETGVDGQMRASATEMAGRRWEDPGYTANGMDRFVAADVFGTKIALEDGYLPGARCLEALGALDTLSAEAEMVRVSRDLAAVADTIREHPEILDDGAFSANDGRNVVRSHSTPRTGFDLDLEDQSNRHMVRLIGNRIDVVGLRREPGGERRCLDLSFAPDEGGRLHMSGVIGQDKDAVRCWNGLVAAASTLACCVAEEVSRKTSAPGPR